MNLAFQLSPANDSVAKANADEALRVAGEAVQLAPEMSGPHAAIGHVLHALGRDKEAQPHLVAATRLAPTSWHAYQLLAEIAAFEGRIAEMRPLLDSAIALTPNVTNIYNYRRARAMTLLADGNPRQAMTDLEAAARDAEAIGARGQANLTHLFIVSAAAATGDTAAIEQHLTKARSLGAAVGTAADYSLSAYGLTGQPQRARVAYDTLARLNAPQPNLSPATNAARERYLHRQRGWLLLAERKPVEAIAEFRQADVNPYVSVGIVEALQMQKKTKEADAERAAFFERREYSFVSTGVPIMRFRARKK